jgi:hypothetical protein
MGPPSDERRGHQPRGLQTLHRIDPSAFWSIRTVIRLVRPFGHSINDYQLVAEILKALKLSIQAVPCRYQ